MRAGIRQVAAEAGVSTATVSRVLSGRGPASARAIAAVQSAARRLDYLPSASASSLRTDRSMIIGVLVPNLANPVFLPFLRAVEHMAQRHGYAVLVADTQRSPEVERRQLDRLSAQRVNALIMAGRSTDPGHVRALSEAGLPVVDSATFADQAGYPLGSFAAEAITDACTHLAALGHRRLAYLSRGPSSLGGPAPGAPARGGPASASTARWQLIEAACRSLPITPERTVVRGHDGPDEAEGDRRARFLGDLVRSTGGPTVIWSNSHVLTPLLLEGLAVAAIDIPSECSFITFGDSPWATAYRPPISVIDIDLDGAAAAMTASILRRLGVDEPDPTADVFAEVYRPRSSVGPAPDRR